MIKLSIALTTYNHEKYIATALDSVFKQNINCEMEVVIGNDCSTDNTAQIIDKYRSKYANIKVLTHKKNVGYTVNFDKTMRACTGEYIAIFDGDDIMLPNKLQQQVDFLDNHSDYVMITHKNRAFNSATGATIKYINPPTKKKYYTIKDFIKYGSIVGNSSKMFRKSAYPKSGIDYHIKHIADWYITIQIAQHGKTGYINKCLVDYRIHQQSIMKQIRGDMHFNDKVYILQQVSQIFNQQYDHLFHRQCAYAHLIRGIYYVNQQQLGKARLDFMKSILKSPFYSPSAYIRFVLTFLPKMLANKILKSRLK